MAAMVSPPLALATTARTAFFSLVNVWARQPSAAGHWGCRMLPERSFTSSTAASNPSFMVSDGSYWWKCWPKYAPMVPSLAMKLIEPGAWSSLPVASSVISSPARFSSRWKECHSSPTPSLSI